MKCIVLLFRSLGWLTSPAPEPAPAPPARLPVNPPRCYCGHLCVHHENGTSWCVRCTCSYTEPVTVETSSLGGLT